MKPAGQSIIAAMLSAVLALFPLAAMSSPETDKAGFRYQPTLQPDKSFEQLKKDLAQAFGDYDVFKQLDDGAGIMVIYGRPGEFDVTDDGLSIAFKQAEVLGRSFAGDIESTFRIQYDELADVLRNGACSDPEAINPKTGTRFAITFALPRKINFVNFRSEASLRAACDAMHNLALRYQEKAARDDARFKEQAASYRLLKAKPEMSEQQRRLAVQAEAFREERKFAQAIERYRQLVAEDPVTYPAAYFNLALMSAELKLYRTAIRNMQRYLLLMPTASDARAAQDKIYAWETKIRP